MRRLREFCPVPREGRYCDVRDMLYEVNQKGHPMMIRQLLLLAPLSSRLRVPPTPLPR
jgi:hypothetical protein